LFSEKVGPSRKKSRIIPSAVRLERIENSTFIKMEKDHTRASGKQEHLMW
jgi:hypothetical protein